MSRIPPGRLRSDEAGQAAVELALVLPVVALLIVAMLQAAMVLRDQLLVVQAAREGAREAAVTARPERIEAAVRRAAPGLDVGLTVRRGDAPGDLTTVTVRSRPTRLPVVGAAIGNHRIEASATMRVERAGP